jgi:hypothetical protein
VHIVGPWYGEKTENHGKWETHTVGGEIWLETMNMARNTEKGGK